MSATSTMGANTAGSNKPGRRRNPRLGGGATFAPLPTWPVTGVPNRSRRRSTG